MLLRIVYAPPIAKGTLTGSRWRTKAWMHDPVYAVTRFANICSGRLSDGRQKSVPQNRHKSSLMPLPPTGLVNVYMQIQK